MNQSATSTDFPRYFSSRLVEYHGNLMFDQASYNIPLERISAAVNVYHHPGVDGSFFSIFDGPILSSVIRGRVQLVEFLPHMTGLQYI